MSFGWFLFDLQLIIKTQTNFVVYVHWTPWTYTQNCIQGVSIGIFYEYDLTANDNRNRYIAVLRFYY